FQVKQEVLGTYEGVYANKDVPLKITISLNDSVLTAQATGQAVFPLEATSETRFKYDPARVVIIFNTEKKELILKQHGGVFIFYKE
ncbi:MAG TPA: hypothetical protein VK750_05430, partial [Cytophagaceae bacterium]|nr:hypothetical protein [Cytophagaceae bacterium]